MTITYAYAADISKWEKTDSGDLLVHGIATDPTKDMDGQRCDPAWLKTAMPEWFEWGNVRDQHSSVAAGVATEMDELPGDAWWVKTLVTDPVAQHKVETTTYKGYSIGIRDAILKMINGEEWICGGKIVEVSLVDRPCNPTAKLALAKGVTPGGTMTVQPGQMIDVPRMLIKCAQVIELPENASLPGDHWVNAKGADKDQTKTTPVPVTSASGLQMNALNATIARLNDLVAGANPPPKVSKTFGRKDLELSQLKVTLGGLNKVDHDPDNLAAVRNGLVACLTEELTELCNGQRELGDVQQLLTSLDYFMCWWCGEAFEGEVAGPYDDADQWDIWLAADGDTTKEATVASDQSGTTAGGDKAATSAQDPTNKTASAATGGETRKGMTSTELAELVKTAAREAVTEATADLKGRLDLAESTLAKVAGAPQAGGPALMGAQTSDTTKAADAQAEMWEAKARNTTDSDLRYFYAAKAKALRATLTKSA